MDWFWTQAYTAHCRAADSCDGDAASTLILMKSFQSCRIYNNGFCCKQRFYGYNEFNGTWKKLPQSDLLLWLENHEQN